MTGRSRAGIRAGWVFASLALLAGCVPGNVRAPLPPGEREAAEAVQLQREQRLSMQDSWGLAGRIAVSNGSRGGSGRIDWQQDKGEYTVSMSAPITRQSWRLSGNEVRARLEGLEGGPREGPDAVLLLHEATGWKIPVVALTRWIRGARAPGLGPAELGFGADGRLLELQQAGWAIKYEWPDAQPQVEGDSAAPIPAVETPLLLPSRIEARSGDAKVKLVIDEWVTQ